MLPTTTPRKSVVRSAASVRRPRCELKARDAYDRLVAMLQTGPVAWPVRYRLTALAVGVVLVASACSHRTKNRVTGTGPTASASADASGAPNTTSGPQT